MAFVVKDRVKETSTTTGTGTFTLDGAATGFQSFSAIGNGNTTYYTISGGSQWEVGIGIYTASGTTLSRDTVLASSNNGNLVDFSAGSKDVYVVYPSGRAVIVNGSTVEVPNSAVLPVSAGGTGSATAAFSGANISGLNASNVSSGILAVAQGGTGSATAAFSGANITSLNASNVSSGILAVAQGGTGSSTATFSGANITSLNASNVSTGVLAIARGGTGSADATFSGANITSLNASNISTGTIANAYTTASSANGASTIVARGASGEFAAGAITGTSFSGDGSAVTSINGSNISSGTVANARTTAASANGASTLVARDASGNFSANTITASLSGTATTGTNWGAYGAVPAAGTSFGNANTIGRSDGNGYTFFGYINSSTSNSENPTVSQVIVTNGGDNYYRKASIAHLTGSLSGTAPINITGNSNNITAYTINQSLGTGNSPTFTDIYNNGWFRNNNTATGLYNQATGRGIWSAENYNSYGSYTTYGSGLNGWIGWGLQGSFHFMGRTNTDCGLYDSSNGKWLIYGLYNSNGVGLNTSTTSASYGAYVNGGLYATGNVVAYSDQRKKENIVTVNDPVNILMNLRGVYYNRIDDNDKKRQIGVIAQEVEKVLPEVVNYAPDVDEYGVSYGNFAGLFIEVLKTQQKEIVLLRQEIEQLKGLKNGNDNYN